MTQSHPSHEETFQSLPKLFQIDVGESIVANEKTIDFMKKVARIRSGHPLVRQFAIHIVHSAGIKSNDFIGEARAIGEYVQHHVRYVRDPNGIEYLQDPVNMILDLKNPQGMPHGDCDDMALLIATLLLAIGHDVSFKAIRYNDDLNYHHIYVVAYDGSKDFGSGSGKIVLDAIFKDKAIGYEVPHHSGKEYRL
jgi:hypothetical protein